MAGIDDDAAAWAAQNPNDPRSVHIAAKAWANQNPQDPRASGIAQKAAGALSAIKQASQPQPDQGAAMSLGEHAANAGAAGYLPQIVGAGTSLALKASDLIHGTHNADLVPYSQIRDNEDQTLNQESAQHPVASGVGTFAGSALAGAAARPAFSAIPGAAAEGTGLAARAARVAGLGAGGGAAYGALENPGDTPGQVDPLQLGQRADNAIHGAKTGALTAGLFEGAGAGLNTVGAAGKYVGGKLARFSAPQTEAYAQDAKGVSQLASDIADPAKSVGVQDTLHQAQQSQVDKLRQVGLDKDAQLKQLLSGTRVNVPAKDLRGLNDSQINSLLDNGRGPNGGGYQEPSSFEVPGTTARDLKNRLQDMSFSDKIATSPNAPQAFSQDPALAQKAKGLNDLIKAAGGSQVQDLNNQMRESMQTQEALKAGMSNPIASLATGSADKLGNIARAAQITNDPSLLTLANRVGAAQKINMGDVGSSGSLGGLFDTQAVKAGGRFAIRQGQSAQDAAGKLSSPALLNAILAYKNQHTP